MVTVPWLITVRARIKTQISVLLLQWLPESLSTIFFKEGRVESPGSILRT
jgi:hypothetical protein